MRNAHLALDMKQSNSYRMKTKPSLWQASRGSRPHELFLTVLELESPENLGRPYQPLALLTRTLLPDFPSILLYLQVDQTSYLRSTSIINGMKITEKSLAELNSFTLRVYKDIFNKEFEDNVAEMSYWLAPVLVDRNIDRGENSPESLIDWSIVQEVFQKKELGWDIKKPHSYLANRYFVDKWDGGRRFFSVKVMPDMRPQDPVPADAVFHKYKDSILDYSITLFKNSRKKASWSPDQPVVLAHRVLHRLNWLDKYTEKEKENHTISYICPEPLLISAVRGEMLSSSSLLTNPFVASGHGCFYVLSFSCDIVQD
jgi:endoribonuclease Dicer